MEQVLPHRRSEARSVLAFTNPAPTATARLRCARVPHSSEQRPKEDAVWAHILRHRCLLRNGLVGWFPLLSAISSARSSLAATCDNPLLRCCWLSAIPEPETASTRPQWDSRPRRAQLWTLALVIALTAVMLLLGPLGSHSARQRISRHGLVHSSRRSLLAISSKQDGHAP